MNSFNLILKWAKKPFRLEVLHRWLAVPGTRVLDVGCGNHSPKITKQYYPLCEYHGLDRDRRYNLSEEDFSVCEYFWEIDLEDLDAVDQLLNNYFDVVIVSHVLEHLINGDQVLRILISKIRPGGVIYIETPSGISLHLPSMRGTLNFYDDESHVRFYPLRDIEKILTMSGCRILRSGLRRSWKRIVLFPFALFRALMLRKPPAGVFWDLLGFAQYVVAQKITESFKNEKKFI